MEYYEGLQATLKAAGIPVATAPTMPAGAEEKRGDAHADADGDGETDSLMGSFASPPSPVWCRP